uniref:Uncharacterized protein n=1 Tax=Desulfobacca acetoxidans TaxID=60893 RepID=A0A7C5EPX1_9BACT
MKRYFDLGMDIGSVSVKLVVMAETGEVLREEYRSHQGEPYRAALALLEEVGREFPLAYCRLRPSPVWGGKSWQRSWMPLW